MQSPEYSATLLQIQRPQPMYDKQIHRLYGKLLSENPGDNHELIPEFKVAFLEWLAADRLNTLSGYAGYQTDVCIGCTHYIDDLYQTVGRDRLRIFTGDYRYHWRLNPDLVGATVESLRPGDEVLISMPFASMGDVHPQMPALLTRCEELGIPVHVDAAWLPACRDIHFDFSHPAIASFAISLSKGMGMGSNRVALRFVRERKPGPITIMNDFNMNCQSLVYIGTQFMKTLGPNYFWNKYSEAYAQVCADFGLTPTKAIHLALNGQQPVGVRLLLRHLRDH